MTTDLSFKLAQVIEQIPKDVLCGFLRSNAQSHEELAMALVSEFWQDSLSKLSSPLGLPKEFAQMEQQLKETHPKEEDWLFYYHSSEERIVLSHALFWKMTLPQFFNPENLLPSPVVAEGFGGDMDEELANILLDDMDFDKYGKVKCRMIEHTLPKLMKMVEGEML